MSTRVRSVHEDSSCHSSLCQIFLGCTHAQGALYQTQLKHYTYRRPQHLGLLQMQYIQPQYITLHILNSDQDFTPSPPPYTQGKQNAPLLEYVKDLNNLLSVLRFRDKTDSGREVRKNGRKETRVRKG